MATRRLNTTAARAQAPKQPAAGPLRTEAASRVVRATVGTRQETYHDQQIDEIVLTETFAPNEPPAYVTFKAGMTINLQNYESLRLDCEVTLPCKPSEINEAQRKAADFVAEKLEEEREVWMGAPR